MREGGEGLVRRACLDAFLDFPAYAVLAVAEEVASELEPLGITACMLASTFGVRCLTRQSQSDVLC